MHHRRVVTRAAMGHNRIVHVSEGRFDGRAPHLVHAASGACVWFTRPLGLVTQIGHRTHADGDVARFFSVTASEELLRRRTDDTGKIPFLHDWRRLTGYTPEARQVMTSWGLAMRPYAERIVIALAPTAKMARMGVSVAAVALQLAGFTVETVDDLEATIDRLRLAPAP